MATATPLPISVSEYLHTSYQPDCESVDGVIEERSLGELDHAELQRAFIRYLLPHERGWKALTVPEIRIRTSDTHVRIAGIAVISVNAPREQVIETPPVAVIEVLSPEDRVPRYAERLADYRVTGIKNIWVVDPVARKGFDFSADDWIETARFAAPDTPISIDPAALFGLIEEDPTR